MLKVRNHSLDWFKGIACIAVVFFHVSFPGSVGLIVNTITRFAVPFFFMVSGYYSFHAEGRNADSGKRHIAHILKIIIACAIVYVPASFLFEYWGDTVNSSVNDVGALDAKGIFAFLVFNQPVVLAGQLWFLFALLYDYILYYFLEKRISISRIYFAIPVLFFLYIVLAQGLHVAGVKVPNYLYRNFLIEGFAFFLFAHYLHSIQDRIHISNFILVIVFAISTIGCIIERKILSRSFGVNICTIPQVASIFIFCIKNPEFGWKTRLGKLFCAFGEKFSLLIYVIHPFVWRMINWFYKLGMDSWWKYMNWLKPILVLMVTVLVSFVFYFVKSKLDRPRTM